MRIAWLYARHTRFLSCTRFPSRSRPTRRYLGEAVVRCYSRRASAPASIFADKRKMRSFSRSLWRRGADWALYFKRFSHSAYAAPMMAHYGSRRQENTRRTPPLLFSFQRRAQWMINTLLGAASRDAIAEVPATMMPTTLFYCDGDYKILPRDCESYLLRFRLKD